MSSLKKTSPSNNFCRVNQTHQGARPKINQGQKKCKSMIVTSFAHPPHTKKKGVEIDKSINIKVTTIDQAPGQLLRHRLMS